VAKAKAIIKRRKAVVNTRKITKTMELVSTAKYQQGYGRVVSAKPYRDTLQAVMRDLARAVTDVQHPLLARREPPRHVTYVVLTSNRGLAGGFNGNLVRMARAGSEQSRDAGVEVALHVVGKKGVTYFRYLKVTMVGSYVHFGDKPLYPDVEKLADELIAAYSEGRTDRVVVVYQKYYSSGVQRPIAETLLPIETEAAAGGGGAGKPASDYIYSPDPETLLRQLLPAYFKTALYHAFLETVVGEHRARMVAMKNATDNADTMIKSLTRLYNRARQSQITNEISEIMGGVEALK
jgi:F-type H+-transporting ATPase subunit gamma